MNFPDSDCELWPERINNNKTWDRFTRENYCFFVVRYGGTSTAQHARHSTSRHDSHDTSCLSCRDVTQQWLNSASSSEKEGKTDRQITNRLNAFVILIKERSSSPVACSPVACDMPVSHSDCRQAILGMIAEYTLRCWFRWKPLFRHYVALAVNYKTNQK